MPIDPNHPLRAHFLPPLRPETTAMTQTEDHAFRPPFRTIEEGESVRVVDASGFPLCWIYFEDEASRALIMKRMNRRQAREIAGKIAALGAGGDVAQ